MSVLQNYLDDLAELVNLEAGTSNPAGVTQAAEVMKRHFESIGFACELADLGPEVGRGLIATNKPGAERYDVMLNAHLDTVFPLGTAAERPFSRDEEKCYGPGCLDCKAGCLSIFYSLKNARKEDLDRLAVLVALNPDEETGSVYSAKWLHDLGRNAERVLICEPARANGALVRSRKGSAEFEVIFSGRSAHAGNNPQDGRNAVAAMARFISAVYEHSNIESGNTICPSIVEGGKIANAVPAHASVVLDTRYWRDEDGKATEKLIRELAAKTWIDGVTAEVRQHFWIPAMPLSEKTRELVRLIEAGAASAGFTPEWVDAGGASDGNFIAESGVPVVDGCGPIGDNMHTDKEFVKLDSVEERIRMLSDFYSHL